MNKETEQLELIDSRKLAEVLKVKYTTVRSWVSQNKVPGAVKINGCRRFILYEVLKWIDECKEHEKY